jgi:hypothetical protein
MDHLGLAQRQGRVGVDQQVTSRRGYEHRPLLEPVAGFGLSHSKVGAARQYLGEEAAMVGIEVLHYCDGQRKRSRQRSQQLGERADAPRGRGYYD